MSFSAKRLEITLKTERPGPLIMARAIRARCLFSSLSWNTQPSRPSYCFLVQSISASPTLYTSISSSMVRQMTSYIKKYGSFLFFSSIIYLTVYFRPYDANGAAWNMVFPRVIVGMIIFQLTMIGLFVLKKYIVLGVLCVPLIVMTVLFKLVMDAAYKKNCEHLPMQLLRDKVNRLPTHHEAAKETSSSKSRDSTATPPSLTATPATDSENDTDDDDDSSHDDDQAKKLVDSTATVQNRWQRAVHFASSKASLQPQASDSGSLQPTQPLSRSQSRHKRVVLDEDDYEAIPDRRTDYRQPPMMLNPGILDTGFKKYGNPALVGVLPQLWLPVKCPVSGEIRQPLDRSKRLSSSHRNNERGQSSGHLASDLARMLRRAESAARHRAAVALTVGGKGGGPDGGDDHNSRSLVPADAHYSQHESLAKEDRNKTQ